MKIKVDFKRKTVKIDEKLYKAPDTSIGWFMDFSMVDYDDGYMEGFTDGQESMRRNSLLERQTEATEKIAEDLNNWKISALRNVSPSKIEDEIDKILRIQKKLLGNDADFYTKEETYSKQELNEMFDKFADNFRKLHGIKE